MRTGLIAVIAIAWAGVLLAVEPPLRVLHLDFNTIAWEREAIVDALDVAARAGYNAVLWEIEDKVRWETCPSCVAPEAMDKDVFRRVLDEARQRNLMPIPLLQTFGHAEYVLDCEKYRSWRELPDRKECYCASNSEVREFLRRWIREYLELFGDVRYFHLGGDEARWFGMCPVCRSRAKLDLYLEHARTVAADLLEKGIRPSLWSDMFRSPEGRAALNRLPGAFVIWHWDYDYDGKAVMPSFPGHDVVFAASSSCYGDGPFLPDYARHTTNIRAGERALSTGVVQGLCVTSWSVRQGLKALQHPLWHIPGRTDDEAFARAFGPVSRDTVNRLTAWDECLAAYDGRDAHDWMKDGEPADPAALSRILAEKERTNPDFRNHDLERAEFLQSQISAALQELRRTGASATHPLAARLESGAVLTLSFLRAVRAVLEGRPPSPLLHFDTVNYLSSEQKSASAMNGADIIWSVVAGPSGPRSPAHVLACRSAPRNVPELLCAPEGAAVSTSADWELRCRPAILDFFTRSVYGERPVGRPANLRFEPLGPEAVAMGGQAILKQVRIRYSGEHGEGSFGVTAFMPRRATPAPAFLLICNRNPAINIDPTRRNRRAFWPAEEIVARGYAALAFWNDELSSDDAREEFEDGVHAVFGPRRRTETSWGSFSAWAWGASRVMDWIETESRLAADKVAVVGHSRGGKTALWAAACDMRFAMACVNDSGCGGARLNHVELPLAEKVALINVVNPHWYARSYRRWNGREDEMPFDQHHLMALIAPRLLAVGSASEDWGAGPWGEFLSVRLAAPAWKLYGRANAALLEFPEVGRETSDGCLSYHLRKGAHDLNRTDWDVYMNFAARHGW